MNVKRYIAKNMQEAMEKIRDEHGDETMILNSRKIKGRGIRGIMGSDRVEVVVATDGSPSGSVDTREITTSVAQTVGAQMKGVEKTLDALLATVEGISKTAPVQIENDELANFQETLLRNDVRQELVLKLYSRAKRLIQNENYLPKEAAVKVLSDCIGEPVKLEFDTDRQNVVALIGPTGVGKTTTLAKLAAIYALQQNKKAALITADVYRIGAVEQLKTYADIMGLPMEVIPNVDEVTAAIAKHLDADIIFIDTPGKSPSDDQHSIDMQRLIEKSCANNVFLVVSATSNVESLKKIFKTYENISDYKLIVTKTDEAITESPLLNISDLSKSPISYLAFGQNVPNDIEVMDSQAIVRDVVARLKFEEI